ncbi:MAG: tetratricopeptide repeat protein [Candidatus Omnitrophota bacterium]
MNIRGVINSRVFHIAVLVLLAGAVYSNSLKCGFVYDDKAMITAYDFVKDIKNLPAAFMSPTSVYGNVNYYRPLQTVSYIIDYYFWGGLPAGFHFSNILFHIACVILVYLFVTLLFKNSFPAFICSALFAAHPVNVTVVTYVAGRADAMLCSFMLLCFIFYIKYRYGSGAYASACAALVFFTAGLLTKESAMIIPFWIVFFDLYASKYTELEEVKKKRRALYPVFFAILAGYLVFRFAKMSFFVEGAVPPFPLKYRLITVPYNLAQYLRLMILPNDLHVGREPWVAVSLLDGKILVSCAVLLVSGMAVYFNRKKRKALVFGVSWFIFMIFPSLNLITPLFYTLAENWLYIPSIGLFLIAGVLVTELYERCRGKREALRKSAVIVMLLVFSAFMIILTARYNMTWKDEISLGENTLAFNPREFKVYNNVGVAYLGEGDLDKAEANFRKCLAVKPDTGMAYFNLYRVYMARGKKDQAIEYLNKARKLDPGRVGILIEKMGIRE